MYPFFFGGRKYCSDIRQTLRETGHAQGEIPTARGELRPRQDDLQHIAKVLTRSSMLCASEQRPETFMHDVL